MRVSEKIPVSKAVLIALMLSLGGCSPTYWLMPPEPPIPKLPNHTSRVQTGTLHGQAICTAVHEISDGRPHQRVLAMMHGIPSDSEAWRFVKADLAKDYDLMLIDLLGCGQSDKPAPARLGPAGYSPEALARHVLTALKDRLKDRPSTTRLTLVGHSLGGTVVLRMYADDELRREFADVLERVDGIVLMAPADVAIQEPDPAFISVARLTDAQVAVGNLLGLLKERSAQANREAFVDRLRVPREEAYRTYRILRDRATRLPTQAMIMQAVPGTISGNRWRPDWPRIRRIEEGYRHVQVPCRLIWGEQDDAFTVAMGYKLMKQLPQAHLRVVRDGMHSLAIEHPGATVELIRQFVADPSSPQPNDVMVETTVQRRVAAR